jgi:hypothetical protein
VENFVDNVHNYWNCGGSSPARNEKIGEYLAGKHKKPKKRAKNTVELSQKEGNVRGIKKRGLSQVFAQRYLRFPADGV